MSDKDPVGLGITAMCVAFVLAIVVGLGLAMAEHSRESKFIDNCVEGNKQHPQAFSLCYLELIKAKQMNAVTQFPVQQAPATPTPAPVAAPEKK